ncbi:MAG: hypothetical protein JKY65_09100 [Planctomycetes bacterium]|nr:hypothetical protein [Planctomycetota bacterium]
MESPTSTLTPTLTCGGCKTPLSLSGKRVGDSVNCGCGRLEVITRLKIKEGSLPPAKIMGQLEPQEQKEVDETLRRIKMRRVGHASRNVEIYPTWAIVLSIGQFWLAGIMAAHNLKVTGQRERGRRLELIGGGLYVLLNLAILICGMLFWQDLSPLLVGPVLVAIPLAFGAYALSAQSQTARAAREAGAGQAGVLVPFLFGVIVAIAQAFVAMFLTSSLETGF